jgi:hypothetical protein
LPNSFPQYFEYFLSKPILLYKRCDFVLSYLPESWYYFIGASKLSITPNEVKHNRFPAVRRAEKKVLTGGISMLRIEYFDKDRFMRQVSASHGSVLLHLDNGKTCDLKKDATASSILRMMNAPKKGFDITVTDPTDVTGFLRYMLEAGRTERVAG